MVHGTVESANNTLRPGSAAFRPEDRENRVSTRKGSKGENGKRGIRRHLPAIVSSAIGAFALLLYVGFMDGCERWRRMGCAGNLKQITQDRAASEKEQPEPSAGRYHSNPEDGR